MTNSGKYWVAWANENARNSRKIEDLQPNFRACILEFMQALKQAGASITINTTKRSPKRAYLFHWSWKIYIEKCDPSEAQILNGVDIKWDHGSIEESINSAREMVEGFGLAVPPRSVVAPSMKSNHIKGKAIDMDIIWNGIINVKDKKGKIVELTFNENILENKELIEVGSTYGVYKLETDKPHWSYDGR